VSKKINSVTRRGATDQLAPVELDADTTRSGLPWIGVIPLPEAWAIEKEPA